VTSKVIVFYVSSHGLGHVSRALELIDVLTTKQGDQPRVVVRTNAPPWVFERLRQPAIEVQPLETDTGVAQVGSLTIDEDETIRRAAVFYKDFDRHTRDEAKYLKTIGATIVVGDIPPLAFAAADRAGIPSVAVANFTWDWIYAYYPRFDVVSPGVIETITQAYGRATSALRLPLAGGFDSMTEVVRDIPFIARRSRRDRLDTRRLLGLEGHQLIVLVSFAGHGLALPYAQIGASGLTVLAPEQAVPAGLTYEDLVAAADVVVSKPGYGIVSECLANATPLLYTSRGRFREYDVIVAEMPQILRCRYIEQGDLLSGNWRDAIEALLAQPEPPRRPEVNGAEVAAELICDRLLQPLDD